MFHFRINEPYLIFWTNEPYFIIRLPTLFHFGLTNLRNIEPYFIFEKTNIRNNEPSE